MTLNVFTKTEGTEEVHYIDFVELNVKLKLANNDISEVESIPNDASENIWDAAIYSKIENLRWAERFLTLKKVDLLYIIAELKSKGF